MRGPKAGTGIACSDASTLIRAWWWRRLRDAQHRPIPRPGKGQGRQRDSAFEFPRDRFEWRGVRDLPLLIWRLNNMARGTPALCYAFAIVSVAGVGLGGARSK